ncbi:hypothetical protein NKH99_25475 [Mesorhizobium sp. M0854]|uniref:hypothetical protein n=1 Tax=Mesorhizobium sp. M0854 TaxID=2957013 RepID=UPI00333DDD06
METIRADRSSVSLYQALRHSAHAQIMAGSRNKLVSNQRFICYTEALAERTRFTLRAILLL